MEKSFAGKLFKGIFTVFFTLAIILYSDKMSSAAEEGLRLWLNTVVPSLFPFMVISSWLTFRISERKTVLDRLTFGLFGVPASLMAIFPVSVLSGYPVGAKIISGLYSNGAISKDTAEHLFSFCNNPGAVFILSAVASSILGDKSSAVFFMTVCVLSSLTGGILYNFAFPAEPLKPIKLEAGMEPGIYSAISSAVGSVLLVGGCIIFFSAVSEAALTLFPLKSPAANAIVSGVLEFTQGIKKISAFSPRFSYPIICAMLCWGGFSVHLQTAALIGGCGLPLKKYIIGKAICAACAYILSVILYDSFFPQAPTEALMSAFAPVNSGLSLFALSAFSASAVCLIFGEKNRRN